MVIEMSDLAKLGRVLQGLPIEIESDGVRAMRSDAVVQELAKNLSPKSQWNHSRHPNNDGPLAILKR